MDSKTSNATADSITPPPSTVPVNPPASSESTAPPSTTVPSSGTNAQANATAPPAATNNNNTTNTQASAVDPSSQSTVSTDQALHSLATSLRELLTSTNAFENPHGQKVIEDLKSTIDTSTRLSRALENQQKKVQELEKTVQQGGRVDSRTTPRHNAITIMEAFAGNSELTPGHKEMLRASISKIAKDPDITPEALLQDIMPFSEMVLTSRRIFGSVSDNNNNNNNRQQSPPAVASTPPKTSVQTSTSSTGNPAATTTAKQPDTAQLLARVAQLETALNDINKTAQVERQRTAQGDNKVDQRQRHADLLNGIINVIGQNGRSSGTNTNNTDPYGALKQQQQQQQTASNVVPPQSSGGIVNASKETAEQSHQTVDPKQIMAESDEIGRGYLEKYLNFGAKRNYGGGVINASAESGRRFMGETPSVTLDIEALNRYVPPVNKTAKTMPGQDISARALPT